jgi:transposase InsO family protein
VPKTTPDKGQELLVLVELLIVDFTEFEDIISVGICLYLLRRVKAFPTWTEKAWEVVRCLLKEIIPRSIGSDNGPAFVAEVVQLMAKGLGITWKLHMAYHLQSSEKVEHMNRTLKSQLGKLCQETHLQWNQLLPIALFRIRSSPTKRTGLLLFEVFYGHPSSLIKGGP